LGHEVGDERTTSISEVQPCNIDRRVIHVIDDIGVQPGA
jgi:hypothetical protein